MAVNWGGVAGMIVFYLIILAIGLLAARKTRGSTSSERILIADRKFGWLLSTCTLTDGVFFAEKMRAKKYVTFLDPFSIKYGPRMTSFIFLATVIGEILYTASILTALGSSISIILNIDRVVSVVVSSCIAAFYTLFGGIWSVAYTDIAQLILSVGGLWFCLPFALTNPIVSPVYETKTEWLGEWDNKYVWIWLDLALLLVFSSLPWQGYYQRVFAAKTSRIARNASIAAALGLIICVIPAYVFGIVGASANWNETSINLNETDIYGNPSLILPASLQYLTPAPVAFFGLGAVSAAVMSSTDSTFLSSSSMFGENIYKNLFRPKASEREIIWIMRLAIVIIAALSCVFALVVKSTYGLFILCGEFIYAIMVPQLICVIHAPISNTYGAATAFVAALVLRVISGEPAVNLPPLIRYPLFEVVDGVPTQFFPFRTLLMVIAIVTLLLVSLLADAVFTRGWLDKKWDVFRCFNVNGEGVKPVSIKGEERVVDNKAFPFETASENADTRL